MNWQIWKKRLSSPQELAQWAETVDPRLGKHVLNYASRILEPDLMLRGFQVLEWSDERMGLALALNARSCGAFVTLSEFMLQAVLGRHLLLEQNRLTIEGAGVTLSANPNSISSIKMELSGTEREFWIKEAHQSPAGALRETVVLLWSSNDQRLGEIRLSARLTMRMALPS